MSLSPREIEVLNIIVQAYIQSASPIGSRYVAKQSSLNLSPATMRNIMADLTEQGFLMQPHTSAGRIPTQKAFRYYVDSVLKPSSLSEQLRQSLRQGLEQASLDYPNILEQVSKLISSQASQVGMALAPQQDFVRWHRIDFVQVRPGLVMAILIFQGGIVHNRLITVDDKVTTDDLIRYSNFLNDKFQGSTLFEVRHTIIQEMQEAEDAFNALYSKALRLAQAAADTKSERELFLDGTLNVLDRLDGLDMASMRELLEFLEHRSELLDLLEKVSQGEGLTVVFGSEFYGPELGEWGIISSPYRVGGETLGVVGTIGPINMDYPKLVPMVDYIAKMLSQILESRF
jgi:heat-inducible transcriptional repressor